MKTTIQLARLLACGALAFAGAAQAATTWYLKDVTFNRAAGESIDQATGWFVFDEATNTYTDWNISVASVNGMGSSFTFDSALLSNKIAWGGAAEGLFRAEESRDLAFVISLSFAESLATASGEVALTGGGISRVFRQYSLGTGLVGGSITTSAVPETETGVAFALGLLGLMAVALYLHARVSFGDARVMSWLAGHTARAMSGEREACDDFTDDVEVALLAQGRRGHWEVEGGKDEICGYYKQGSAALTVLQASTHTQFDDLTVVRSGFPWRSATVSFVTRTSVNVRGAPATTIESEDTVTLVRTLSGMKIKSLESRSTGGL